MNQTIQRGNKSSWPPAILIYTDGASRGNPGPASAGVAVFDTRTPPLLLYEEAFLLGDNTNNFAEYQAVLRALQLSAQLKVKEVTVKSDSELLVRQMTGHYKVKALNLKPLYKECKQWEQKIPKVVFKHVPREQNKHADSLANKVLDGLKLMS